MTIEDWIALAYATPRRRPSAAKDEARARHLREFPAGEIDVELDLGLLDRTGAILKGPLHRSRTGSAGPHRGARGDAPQTPIIVALANRVTRLRAAGVGGNSNPSG